MAAAWNDPELLRQRAEEARLQAAKVGDPEARRILLAVAACYEKMAADAAARRRSD